MLALIQALNADESRLDATVRATSDRFMNQADQDSEFELRAYLRILARRKRVVVLSALGLLALALALSLTQAKTYSASTTALVPQSVASSVNPSQPQAFTSTDLLDRQLQDEILFAQGDAVKQAVHATLGRVPSMTITPIPQSDILSFQAQAPTAALAARYADVYASAYLQERRQSKTQDYLKTAAVLRGQINSLRSRKRRLATGDPSQSAIQASIDNLQSSLSELLASGELSRVGGEIVANASVPQSPTSPNIVRNGAIGAFLGLLLGLWLAFLVDRFDDSIKSTVDLETASGNLPILGVIPWIKSWDRPKSGYVVSIEQPTSPSSESYRTLRTALERLRTQQGDLRTIAVTSALAGEGKTATVANLGAVMASAGRRVAIVDCDLRRPRLQSFFDLPGRVGLTAVLQDGTVITEAMQKVDALPSLTLIASGEPPVNPSEFLALSELRQVIAWLAGEGQFEIVLIDCPPVLPVPDALQLGEMVDGMVIVAAAGKAKKREIKRTVELLRQVNAPLLGTILNGIRHTGADAYGYYGYDYTATEVSGNGAGLSARPRSRLWRGPFANKRWS
jgi:capsular exopolysaccharide synthesis family protein